MILTLIAYAVMFFFLWMALGFLREFINMVKYREEHIACLQAIQSDSEEAVNQVNRWTRHYYVHKSFRASSSRQRGLRVGYHYTIGVRPRDPLGGGGGGDMIIPF